MTFPNFMMKLILLTAIMTVGLAGVNYWIPFFRSFQTFSWLSLLFFFLLTALTGWLALKGVSKKTGLGFVTNVNAVVMIKIFLSVIFVILYVVLVHPENIGFITSFFFLYIVFTVFEVRQIVLAQKLNTKASE